MTSRVRNPVPFRGRPRPRFLLFREGCRHVYIDGGVVIQQALEASLVDTLIVSVIPILLGGGTPLFRSGLARTSLKLVGSECFESGLVQLSYAPG